MPRYQVRNKSGKIEYEGENYKDAVEVRRYLPNGSKLLQLTKNGWSKAVDPEISSLESQLKKL